MAQMDYRHADTHKCVTNNIMHAHTPDQKSHYTKLTKFFCVNVLKFLLHFLKPNQPSSPLQCDVSAARRKLCAQPSTRLRFWNFCSRQSKHRQSCSFAARHIYMVSQQSPTLALFCKQQIAESQPHNLIVTVTFTAKSCWWCVIACAV